MTYWSNIEVSPQDPEIEEIDNLGRDIGEFSEDVKKVRELIRRFEVCHFKYKAHLHYLTDSIDNICPNIEPTTIGENHLSKGEMYVKRDTTGRSESGQQYVCALKRWLGYYSQQKSEYFNVELTQKIIEWLGEENAKKRKIGWPIGFKINVGLGVV